MKAVMALFLVLVTFCARPRAYAGEGSATPPSREQEAVFRALDVRLASLEALVAKVDDPTYKASMMAVVEDFKKRRDDLKRSFDQAQFDALMHNVNRNYQIVSLWLKPPRTAAPADEKKG